jgi:hypothetical protein
MRKRERSKVKRTEKKFFLDFFLPAVSNERVHDTERRERNLIVIRSQQLRAEKLAIFISPTPLRIRNLSEHDYQITHKKEDSLFSFSSSLHGVRHSPER